MRWVPVSHEARVQKLFLDTYSSFAQNKHRLTAIAESKDVKEDDDNFFRV
jgi:hypothetical protein